MEPLEREDTVMWCRIVASAVGVVALVAGGCSEDGEGASEATTTTVEESTTSAEESTTSAAVTSTTEPNDESMPTEQVSLTWDTPTGEAWPLDVITPVDSTEGGWPVLVTFHGTQPGTSAGEMDAVAESGVVVVGPRWIDPAWGLSNPGEPGDYVDGGHFDMAKCALSAAQAAAADHGGDPARTTVEGFSAGVHAAAWVGLGVVRDDLCPEAEVIAPTGVALGDSQWIFQHQRWDPDFADDTTQALDTVARFLDPDRWSLPEGFVAHLWSSASGGESRPVGNPPAADSWVHSRGDVVDDLDQVGAFDDELIFFTDNGRLHELRMKQAGVAVTYEDLLGGHQHHPTAIERTIELIDGETAPG